MALSVTQILKFSPENMDNTINCMKKEEKQLLVDENAKDSLISNINKAVSSKDIDKMLSDVKLIVYLSNELSNTTFIIKSDIVKLIYEVRT